MRLINYDFMRSGRDAYIPICVIFFQSASRVLGCVRFNQGARAGASAKGVRLNYYLAYDVIAKDRDDYANNFKCF